MPAVAADGGSVGTMPESLAGPRAQTGIIEVLGPNGQGSRRVRISPSDTPQVIEHCLRAGFGLPSSASVLLLDADGCVAPLGPGLLAQARPVGPEETAGGGSPSAAHFRLEVVRCSPCRGSVGRTTIVPPAVLDKSDRRSTLDPMDLPGNLPGMPRGRFTQLMHVKPTLSTMEEQRFWIVLAEESRLGHEVNADDHARQLVVFDTSAHRIDYVFDQWAESDALIPPERLLHCFADELGVILNEQQLDEALGRVLVHLQAKDCPGITSPTGAIVINRAFFSSIWQRMMLGAVCRPNPYDDEGHQRDILLMRYTQRLFTIERCTDEQLFFRSRKDNSARTDGTAQWVRADHAGPLRLVKFGVKFFLHPTTTKDAITASAVGITRIDRYRHQYFVSLETYALHSPATMTGAKKERQSSGSRGVSVSMSNWTEDAVKILTPATGVGKFGRVKSLSPSEEPPPVAELVVRSSVFLVATGNPHVGYRDWILSIVNAEREDLPDPNDFFRNDPGAAVQVLNDVQRELEAQGRLREYRADYLLYTIIDNAVSQVMPICIAYGHRLRYLHRRLDTEKLRIPTEYAQEVSRARLELQELRQWVGQMLGIMKHLEDDCKADIDGETGQIPWNFGVWASGAGKSMLISIHNTQSHLGQISDRLSVLNEISLSFTDSHQRYRDAFTNQTLLMLTVATAAFMPAQFLAGVYGTNFVQPDGRPAIPELNHERGYLIFWLLSVGLVLTGAATLYCCVRRRSL